MTTYFPQKSKVVKKWKNQKVIIFKTEKEEYKRLCMILARQWVKRGSSSSLSQASKTLFTQNYIY